MEVLGESCLEFGFGHPSELGAIPELPRQPSRLNFFPEAVSDVKHSSFLTFHNLHRRHGHMRIAEFEARSSGTSGNSSEAMLVNREAVGEKPMRCPIGDSAKTNLAKGH